MYINSYGNALFSTYELVVLIYPESDISTRIYTSENLPTYDREGSLEKSVKKFCQTEVHPMDQARYLEFLDFASIPRRIEASAKRFIQGFSDAMGKRHDELVHRPRHPDSNLCREGVSADHPGAAGQGSPMAG